MESISIYRSPDRLSLIVVISLCISMASLTSCSSSSSSPVHRFRSCLTDHGVGNFTMHPIAAVSGGGAGGHARTEDDNSLLRYYSLLNFSIHNLRFSGPSVPKPAAIVLPGSQDQLVSTVSCCSQGRWEIRVRSGGHSYEGTSWVAADGVPFVIIDMMNLNTVKVDLQAETAWVGGGATLGETYAAIAEASRLHGFPAGSCPTVGVGGHISGGGFGLMSRKFGLAADNVEDAILVDSRGRVLDRRSMGENIFWAIRGGGGGIWGIVYAWKIKLVKVPEMVTAFTVSRSGPNSGVGSGSQVVNLVSKWQQVAPSLDDKFYLSAFISASSPGPSPVTSATFTGFFLGPRSGAVSTLNGVFPELGVMEEDCHEMSWIDSVLFFSGLAEGSSVSDLKNRYTKNKPYFKAKSDYVRSPIPMSGIDLALNILQKEPKGYIILDPYGGIMANISGDSIAFPHRKGNLFSIQYQVSWSKEQDRRSQSYIQWIREFYESMAPYVSKSPRAAYVNYIDLDLGVMGSRMNQGGGTTGAGKCSGAVEAARAWGEKYFLGNYERLVRAKTIIDPDNVFRNQQGIPPCPTP